MRPALLGAMTGGGGAVASNISFVGVGASPSIQFPIANQFNLYLPGGLAQNDVIIAAANCATSVGWSLPGWTALTYLFQNTALFWVRRGASDPSTTGTAELSGGGVLSTWCVAYRGCKTSGTPLEGFAEVDIRSTFSEEQVNDGGPLIANDITPSGAGELILNLMLTALAYPLSYDGIQLGSDTGWTNRLDATSQFAPVFHCWGVREIAGVSGVKRSGVTLSGGTVDFASYGASAQRTGSAFTLALLP